MSKKTPTAEQVAAAIFQAQGRFDVPKPCGEASFLDFVNDVGVEVARSNFEKIMGMLSWGKSLEEVTRKLKEGQ
ncbi:hypothetical protein [Deinococcus hopiensis]|uniref:Uncharacterized protein n=1 Tax=Deinococcus hopiensis KR-140 TaxID=695939 RepID=A0A1W1UNL3_9DEIO|nr:hypothetical protein [Deinococcus hopiensis]SMB82613.1 hypothetical protein SAMN00790413_04085 [Deinococcus hopiensis KR-140]